MSHSDWWLATNTTGPLRGTCSAPVTDSRSSPRNSGPATGRTVRQKRSPGSGVAGATGSSATIRADHLLHAQPAAVDHHGVRCRRQLLGVELVALDDRPLDLVDRQVQLRGAPGSAHTGRRHQVDLQVGVRADHRAGVAPLEHGVDRLRPLPPAHGRPHLRMP